MKLYLITVAITQDDHLPILITDSKERAEKISKKNYTYYTEFELNKFHADYYKHCWAVE